MHCAGMASSKVVNLTDKFIENELNHYGMQETPPHQYDQ